MPFIHYKGAMHSQTYWSHDSRGVLEEIVPAAKQAGLQFIFLSDHARGKLDTFPRGYDGFYDGLLIVPGTETSTGLMVNILDSAVINWSINEDSIIAGITRKGGFVGYVHTEKPHRWGNPDYQAMEIYNIHTDLLDETGLFPFIINNLINGSKYKHWAYRELYDDQVAILALWDSLNQHRRIVGFSAVDAHNNQSFRARYDGDGRVEWVGPNAKTLKVKEPDLLEKWLLGEEDAAGWAFKWELDTYFHSFNFVTNHVFSDTIGAAALKDHIARGHLFISFESLAPAAGFQYFALDRRGDIVGILGDSIALADVATLRALSPFPAKMRLLKDGEPLEETRDEQYAWQFDVPNISGSYRLEACVQLDGSWIPWIFTNPIYVY
jgi:hypothetical protein